jgi:Predicted methyltransferase (contains TPR repeat)
MTIATIARPSARALGPYEALAAFYDDLTSEHDYELWISVLEAAARRHGLRGDRLLDIACGTGKSFEPFLRRGWRVTACDLSPAMLERAAARSAGRARLLVADMGDLPPLGRFDLVTCLDEPVNYLAEDELEGAFAGAASCLAPGGLYLFDLNTLHTYRTMFATTTCHEAGDRFFALIGHAASDLPPGEPAPMTIEVFARGRDACWRRHTSRHEQRHHPPGRVRAALEAAGLECLAVLGQHSDGTIESELDEARHTKAVFIARATADDQERR